MCQKHCLILDLTTPRPWFIFFLCTLHFCCILHQTFTIVEQLWLHKLVTCAWVSQVRRIAAFTNSGWLQRSGITESLTLNTRKSVVGRNSTQLSQGNSNQCYIHLRVPSPLAIHSQQAFVHQLRLQTQDNPTILWIGLHWAENTWSNLGIWHDETQAIEVTGKGGKLQLQL